MEQKVCEKLYIKFEEGNQESLDRACKEAEKLGYRDDSNFLPRFQGTGVLMLNGYGMYFTTKHTEEELILEGYSLHRTEPFEWVFIDIQGKDKQFHYKAIDKLLKMGYRKIPRNDYFYDDCMQTIVGSDSGNIYLSIRPKELLTRFKECTL